MAYANLQARQNAEAVLGQATTVAAALEPYDDINGVMLLLPIPPTEDVPQTKYGATNSTQQLDALAQITETFNAGIWNGSSNSGNQSSSFLYWAADNWWKDLSQRDWQPRGPYEGTSLSLDVVETACLVPKDGTQCAGCRDIEEINVCDNPQNYLYWCVLASLLPLYSNKLTYIFFLGQSGMHFILQRSFKKIFHNSSFSTSNLPMLPIQSLLP